MHRRFAPVVLAGCWAAIMLGLAASQSEAAGAADERPGTAGHPKTFHAENKVGKNQLIFRVDTGLERFTGLSNRLRWTMRLDLDRVPESLTGLLRVPVESLDAGRADFNRKLRGPQWLDSKRFPEIRFELTKVKESKRVSDREWRLRCLGRLTIRGKVHQVDDTFRFVYLPESEATRKRAPGHLIHLGGRFRIPLQSFGKASATDKPVIVELNLYGSSATRAGDDHGQKS